MSDSNLPKNDSGSFRYRKVLLIDDDKVDRYISERVIRAANFVETIEVKHAAKEALEYLQALQSSPTELPEIIFLDIELPAMSGFDFLDVFEKMAVRKHCRVFIVTNFPENKLLKSFIEGNYPVENILGKPLTAEVLNSI